MNRIAALVLAVLFTGTAFAQNKPMDPNKEQQLKQIEALMAANDSKAIKGLLIGVGGAATMALSLAFIPLEEYDAYSGEFEETGNPALFWGCLIGGGILMTWGGLKISMAASQNAELKRKWHDLKYSFSPLYLPQHGDAVGLAVTGRF